MIGLMPFLWFGKKNSQKKHSFAGKVCYSIHDILEVRE